jgi:hypothetical protein
MKKIKLTQGKFALVDDKDFDYLNQFKWCYSHGYATRNDYPNSKKIYMHRVINQTPKGFETDHINRDKLDNQRKNLRTVKKIGNIHNIGIRKTNTSGCTGVYWNKVNKNWRVIIGFKSKSLEIGSFKSKMDAIFARKQAERIYWNV